MHAIFIVLGYGLLLNAVNAPEIKTTEQVKAAFVESFQNPIEIYVLND
jgi:hypothetical protein